MTTDLERNMEERMWGIGEKSAQQALAWRMLDEEDDFLFKGNVRVYEDLTITSSEEQF